MGFSHDREFFSPEAAIQCFPNFLSPNTVNYNSGVQGKNNAYHNVNKVRNSFIDALIMNLIDIEVCVVFALYSKIGNDQLF
jgi:hypothetical protein